MLIEEKVCAPLCDLSAPLEVKTNNTQQHYFQIFWPILIEHCDTCSIS